jgi:hypothetical protein
MQEAKHTPGPWSVVKREEFHPSYSEIDAREWSGLAKVVTKMDREGDTLEGQANARLIASAPDLKQGLAYFVLYARQLGAVLPEDIIKWAAEEIEGETRTGVAIVQEAIRTTRAPEATI